MERHISGFLARLFVLFYGKKGWKASASVYGAGRQAWVRVWIANRMTGDNEGIRVVMWLMPVGYWGRFVFRPFKDRYGSCSSLVPMPGHLRELLARVNPYPEPPGCGAL